MDKSKFSFLIALTRQLEMALHERDYDSEVEQWLSSLTAAVDELIGTGQVDEDGAGGPDEDSDGDGDDTGASGSLRGDIPGATDTRSSERVRPRSAGRAPADVAAVNRARTPVHNVSEAQLAAAVAAARREERLKARSTKSRSKANGRKRTKK